MSIAAFLVGMVGPLAARLLASLGVSLITLTGLVATVATLKAQVLTNIGALPLAAIQLGGLMGFWEAAGMVLGTIAFLVTWKGTTGFIALAKS